MGVRQFVRGGYQRLNEVTLITNYADPVGTWVPYDGGAMTDDLPPIASEEQRNWTVDDPVPVRSEEEERAEFERQLANEHQHEALKHKDD